MARASSKREEFTNREQLELFAQRAEAMLESRLAQNEGLQAFFNFNWSAAGAATMTIGSPDEDDLRSYLMYLRQFVMKGEPIHLDKVYSICHKRITSDQLRSNIQEAREEWKRSQKGAGLKVTIDDKNMTPTRVVDLLLNGWYFHSTDPALQRELSSLDPSGRILVRWVFMNFVVDASRQILYLARVIKGCLREGYFDFA